MLYLKKFLSDEDGATAIEYGLIASLISVGAIAAMRGLSDAMNDAYALISTAVSNAVN
ncbi:Flp family type IVb pilin [Limoniibacter endophyticus]|uniref:Flp family type IVb pilin n=1 Tax=Limoniibacter endophyticus TaxID=1565040 RepID=A0A8J3DRT9_9HYPH|nr:Flp family type IVb pilin [Limoniibacter endophyticus]GHC76171.1 hypothetical protein GCM10010136_26620 [Limoniibacter endophyticus]